MAEIELRTYIAEIEELLAAERNEEAIAHCRFLLGYRAKNLAVYRLLGKGLLEQRRFADATDIFYRVLSVAPDDFVAHVGLAIAGEEDGDLVQAVGHMELAFETQPNNASIQAELKRLYVRRDGVEPERVRLTRGALARQYLRGGDFAQAAGELLSELSEKPDRVDLQVLLGEALWKDEQRVEALDVSLKVVEKLPYCLDANCLLYEIWAASGREDEAATAVQRVEAVDPYRARELTGAEVAPSSAELRVTRLDYVPPTPDEIMAVPAWVQELGLSYGEQPLLADAGVDLDSEYSKGDAVVESGPLALDLDGEVESLPDWLQDMVSAEERAAMGVGEEFAWEAAEEPPEELSAPGSRDAGHLERRPAADSELQPPTVEQPPVYDSDDQEPVPGQLVELVEPSGQAAEHLNAEPGPCDANHQLPQSTDEDHDQTRLGDESPSAPVMEESQAPVGEPESVMQPDEVPLAMHLKEQAPVDAHSAEPAGLEPESTVITPPTAEDDSETESPEPAGEFHTLLHDVERSGAGVDQEQEGRLTDQEGVLEWLEQLAVRDRLTSDETMLAPEAEQPLDERPPELGPEPEPPPESELVVDVVPDQVELPEWAKDLASAEECPSVRQFEELADAIAEMADESALGELPVVGPLQPAESLPDWLTGFGESAAHRKPESEELVLPAWLAGMPEPAPDAADVTVPGAAAKADIGGLRTSEDFGVMPEDIGAAIVWLERLAALKGAPPAELAAVSETDAAEAASPPWLADKSAWVESELAQVVASEPMAEPPVEPEETLPGWLGDTRLAWAEKQVQAAPPLEGAEEEDLPDWLRDLRPETTPETEEPALPDWLREPMPAPVESEMELPDWLREPLSRPVEEVGKAPVSGWQPELQQDRPVPDVLSRWLEGAEMAAPPGSTEEPAPEVAAWSPLRDGELPEQPLAVEDVALPDWLLGSDEVPTPPILGVQEESPAGVPEPAGQFEELAAAELPDWLVEESAALPEGVAELPEPELPSWLDELVQRSPEVPELATRLAETGLPESQAEEALVPDFAEPAGEPYEPELPFWLIQEMEREEKAEEPADDLAEPDMPEWLAHEAPEAMDEIAEAELPPWLAELAEKAPSVPESGVERAEPEMPGWLTIGEEMPEAMAEAAGPELPPWLAEMAKDVPGRLAPAAELLEPELPAWLLEELDREEAVRAQSAGLGEPGATVEATKPLLPEAEEPVSPEWPAQEAEKEPEGAEPMEPALPSWPPGEVPARVRPTEASPWQPLQPAPRPVEATAIEVGQAPTMPPTLEAPSPPAETEAEQPSPTVLEMPEPVESPAQGAPKVIRARVLEEPPVMQPSKPIGEVADQLETLEDVTQRVSALQKQIDHRPDDYGVRLVLARAMVEAESVDQALIQYEELVTAERELPYVLGDLERVLQTQPENTWARRLVGDVHLRQGELGQALAAYRLALEQL